MNLENTPLYNSQFAPDVEGKDESPYRRALRRQAQINVIANHLIQQIIAETPYKPDTEWQLWHKVRALDQHPDGSQLPHGITPNEVMEHYYRMYEGE